MFCSTLTGTDIQTYRALQASQHELEKQQMTDELRKKLGRRPERDDLVARVFLSFRLRE